MTFQATSKATKDDEEAEDASDALYTHMQQIWQAMRDKEEYVYNKNEVTAYTHPYSVVHFRRIIYSDDEEAISELFLTKPSKKDYPEYYAVIERPIAMADMRVMICSHPSHTKDGSCASDACSYFDFFCFVFAEKNPKTSIQIAGRF